MIFKVGLSVRQDNWISGFRVISIANPLWINQGSDCRSRIRGRHRIRKKSYAKRGHLTKRKKLYDFLFTPFLKLLRPVKIARYLALKRFLAVSITLHRDYPMP